MVRNPNGEHFAGSSTGSKPVDHARTPNRSNCQRNHRRSRTDLTSPLLSHPSTTHRPGDIDLDEPSDRAESCPRSRVAGRNFWRYVGSGGWSRSIAMMVRGHAWQKVVQLTIMFFRPFSGFLSRPHTHMNHCAPQTMHGTHSPIG